MRRQAVSTLRALTLTAIAALATAACDSADAARARAKANTSKRLVVLGVDGMDPTMLRDYMARGWMPNLKNLSERGSFIALGTANPPQSPVAWSHFIVGADSEIHGIYDFVHRDLASMGPYLSTSKTTGPEYSLNLFGMDVPLPFGDEGGTKLMRMGTPFWELLGNAGIPTTINQVPANYPPAEAPLHEALSGMGTPDVMGTYGTFQVLTEDPAWHDKKVSSGIIHTLDFKGGQVANAALEGPPDATADTGADEPANLTLDARVKVDAQRRLALVEMGTNRVMLLPGEWSEWVPVDFDAGLAGGGSQRGMVRVFVKSLAPYVTVYVSPVNIDPIEQFAPISTPKTYGADIAYTAGRFFTQGMPEESKALTGDVLTDEEYLAHADLIYEERLRMLDYELERFQGGLLFFYFSTIDQVGHMFFRTLDPNASPEDKKHADVIPGLYRRMDEAIGKVMERVGPDTPIMIMSDHGFSPYETKVHLNTWLAERGYLALREDGSRGEGALGHIDWSQTQAYALGLNQVFFNVRGREPEGVVDPEEIPVLAQRLSRELTTWIDPTAGQKVVTRVFPVEKGNYPDRKPDLLIGFNRTYRSSDTSATGQVGQETLSPNTDKWSGDHCMDPIHVPGVLLTTFPINRQEASLIDLAPTILQYFGVAQGPDFQGTSLID